jgi:tetratricopeptide (TPR) repeat protein
MEKRQIHSGGWAYYHRSDNDHAIGDFNQAIALDPKSANAWFGRGLANLYVGRISQALTDLDTSSRFGSTSRKHVTKSQAALRR